MLRTAAVGAAAFSLLLAGMATPVAVASEAEPEQTGTLSWSVQDTDGGPATGATFTVVGAGGDVLTVTDDGGLDEDPTAGAVSVQVPVGAYAVNQVGAAESLEASTQTHTVQVLADGQSPAGAVFVNESTEPVGADTGGEAAEPVVETEDGVDEDDQRSDAVEEGQQAQDGMDEGTETPAEESVVDVEADEVRVEDEAAGSATEDADVQERAPPVEVTEGEDDAATVTTTVAPLQDDPYCNLVPGTGGAFQQQTVDGRWTSGNIGSGYREGDWVPQRAELTLGAGANQFVIEFGYQNRQTIGYDNVRFVRVTDAAGNDIALDSMEVLINTSPGAAWGSATFNFTLPQDAAGTIWFSYDVHLASSLDYLGDGLRGASSYSGSSLQTRRESLNCDNLGGSSLSIPVGQLDSGTVTVAKATEPSGDPTPFDFTITGGGSAADFQLSDGEQWSSQLGTHEFTVTEHDIPAGWSLTDITCTGTTGETYTDDSVTFTLVNAADVLCTFTNSLMQWDDLTVSKTAEASYDRAYTWSIAKDLDPDRLETPQGTPVAADYDVTVTAEDMADANIVVAGEITVDNPNTIPFVVDVIDALPGASCTVEGGTGLVVPPGGASVGYECTSDSDTVGTVGGTNTTTVTWDADDYPGTSGEALGTAPVAFDDPDRETDRYVTVTDAFDGGAPQLLLPDGESLDWVAVSAAGGSHTIEYTQEIAGVAGTCTAYPNLAQVIGDDDVVLDEDVAEVEVCVGTDLEVDKNVVLSMDRSYSYNLDKSVEDTRLNVDPDTGEATFDYTVTVTDGPYTDSTWVMTGQITVTNPNDWPVTGVVSDEVAAGVDATCTVTDPERTIPGAVDGKPGSQTFDYTCAFDGQPDYSGTNTATVTWDADEYFSPSGEATGSVDYTVEDWAVSPINETVTVIDDRTDPANPVELGEHTWTGEGTETDYAYPLTLTGVPGECVTYTNTAWLEQLPDVTDDQQVTVCWPLDLTVTKTVNAAFDREYFWDLTKEVDQTGTTIGEDGVAQFDYLVSATPDGTQDSGWAMSGAITVTNPNSHDVTTAVTDVPDVGGAATCAVADPVLVVPAGGAATTAYTCTFTGKPDYEGTNTATVTWLDVDDEPQSVSTTQDVSFELDGETNVAVEVYDDKVTLASPGELLGVANWHDGTSDFAYSMALPGVAGECVDHTNTAVIPATGDEAAQTVTICVEDELVITKTADASYDREYFWDISKEVDRTEAVVEAGGLAPFTYTVSATPDGFEDSGWAMTGQISVTNPNTYDEGAVTLTLSDSADVGVSCAVVDGEDVVLEPGETRVFDYTCTFEEQPEYEGTNTAVVTWTGPGQEERSTTVEVPVTFDLATESTVEVHVYDDKVTLDSPGELLGLANWHDGTSEFTYTLDLGGKVGAWTYYTNTAVLLETGDSDSQTVRVLAHEPPVTPLPPISPATPVAPVPPVTPVPPVIPTGDPVGGVDGGLLAAGIVAMLLALLGGRVTLIRRPG